VQLTAARLGASAELNTGLITGRHVSKRVIEEPLRGRQRWPLIEFSIRFHSQRPFASI
jgi:hypothetical protein